MEFLTGFAPLADGYAGFIVDLWGVVHDGAKPYPGAVDTLTRLRAAGKRVVLLSNAPRRAAAAQAALRAMGIPDDLYTGIMTSGEASHLILRDRPDDFARGLGGRMYHLGPMRDRNVFSCLLGGGLVQVDTPAEASFVLNTGPDDSANPSEISHWEPVLAACRAAGLPMLCANPDLEVLRGELRVICAGALAQRYEALGGTARWVGKPDPAIYAPVLAMLDVARESVLAVGDALRTDIAGAAAVGIDSCWVLGGIHGAELAGDEARIAAAAAAAGLAPRAVVPSFSW
jgi:HAD superfamily hydrolase (TIGR01459 family)